MACNYKKEGFNKEDCEAMNEGCKGCKYEIKQRPKVDDYNLDNLDSLLNYVSDWNQYSKQLNQRIEELEKENLRLREKLT